MLQKYEAQLALAGRLLLCLLFFYAALFNILNWSAQVALVDKLVGGGIASVSLGFGTGLEILLGGMILVGYQSRWAAVLAALYTISCAILLHPFWAVSAAENANEAMHFFEGLGAAGGFLLIAALGPGALSIDAKREKQ